MTPHLAGMTCPLCNSSLAMPMHEPPIDGDVFVCPGCIAVSGLVGSDCVALSEAELISLRAARPELVAEMDERRIALARHWASEGRAPTLFGAVAANMFLTRGADSLRLPGRDR